MTPTQRTLDRLRKAGWTCQVVEKHAPRFAGKLEINGRLQSVFSLTTRIDLFGCIDVIAIRPPDLTADTGTRFGILGIQATSGGSGGMLSQRLAKIRAEPRMRDWLLAGGLLEVWAWRQVVLRKKNGEKAARPKWEPKVQVVTIEDFEIVDSVSDFDKMAGREC